jgi:7-cyano-7-deazaguanine synthase
MKQQAIVVYSGGMDSFTVLHHALSQGYQVEALSFDYGQRHSKELTFAKQVCGELKIKHHCVDITSINQLLAGSALTSDIAVPEGHYEEQSMQATVVPNRNMILLSLAVGHAVSIGAAKVFYGAHSGDHAIYPDCRPEFVEKMNQVCAIANYEAVEIVTPFLHQDKITILKAGMEMGLDYAKTWTCYKGQQLACGKCGSCQERLEAFAANGITDPLPYQAINQTNSSL